MLILFKQIIKTTLLLLLFTMAATYLYALNLQSHKSKNEIILNPVNNGIINGYNVSDTYYYSSKDTIKTERIDTVKIESRQAEKFSMPNGLSKTPINFRINSFISYLNFNDFVQKESKNVFFQAWLKEKEIQKLSIKTDSLRKMYSNTSLEQKEKISLQILQAEERSIALNDEITEMYQKARDEEDRYWQTASLDEIAKFQEVTRLYKDSLRQIAIIKINQESTNGPAIHDTLTLYKPSPNAEEKKAIVTIGILYKIQIGAYKGKIPESANKLIKKLSTIRKVENHVNDKKFKIYTTGNLRLYTEAVTMLSQVKQEGIKTAVITAYQNGKKITVIEARKLNKEL